MQDVCYEVFLLGEGDYTTEIRWDVYAPVETPLVHFERIKKRHDHEKIMKQIEKTREQVERLREEQIYHTQRYFHRMAMIGTSSLSAFLCWMLAHLFIH